MKRISAEGAIQVSITCAELIRAFSASLQGDKFLGQSPA
jgi:hypothetical protein